MLWWVDIPYSPQLSPQPSKQKSHTIVASSKSIPTSTLMGLQFQLQLKTKAP